MSTRTGSPRPSEVAPREVWRVISQSAGMSPGVSKTAFQLRISLKEYLPVIWRRLLVPGGITMAKLHTIFPAAMGWEDYHLHCFEIDGVRYGIPDPEFEVTDIDDKTVRLSDLVGERARFEYQYDFGDSWCHEEHDEYMNWIAPGFDPDAFNLAAINAGLQRVR